MPHARIHQHQPLLGQGVSGQASDIDIQAREIVHMRDELNETIEAHNERVANFHRQNGARHETEWKVDWVQPIIQEQPAHFILAGEAGQAARRRERSAVADQQASVRKIKPKHGLALICFSRSQSAVNFI